LHNLIPLVSRSSIGYASVPWIGVLLFTEIGKFLISAVLALTCPKSSSQPVWRTITRDWKEGILFAVPALPLVVGNVLQTQYLAHVSLASFHVILSVRILFVGLLASVVMHRKFITQQWVGLVVLTIAAACVQSGEHLEWFFQLQFLVMSLMIAFIGAFGDVGSELLFKQQSEMSFYLKNMYLFAFTSAMTLVFALVAQWDFIVVFYYGYRLSAIALIGCGVLYGLGNSVILYRFDAIWKQFAWVSMLLVLAMAVWVLDQVFYLGILASFVLVGVSSFLYYDHFSLASDELSDKEPV